MTPLSYCAAAEPPRWPAAGVGSLRSLPAGAPIETSRTARRNPITAHPDAIPGQSRAFAVSHAAYRWRRSKPPIPIAPAAPPATCIPRFRAWALLGRRPSNASSRSSSRRPRNLHQRRKSGGTTKRRPVGSLLPAQGGWTASGDARRDRIANGPPTVPRARARHAQIEHTDNRLRMPWTPSATQAPSVFYVLAS